MRKMLTTDGYDVFEEMLEIVSYLTYFSPAVSQQMWTLWPLMVGAMEDWALQYFENILVPMVGTEVQAHPSAWSVSSTFCSRKYYIFLYGRQSGVVRTTGC